MPDLLGNEPETSWAWFQTNPAAVTRGARFQVTTNGLLTQAGFIRKGTGVSYARLLLFNSSGALLWNSGAPADTGTTGDQWTPIDPPLAIGPGITYTIAGVQDGAVWIGDSVSAASRAPAPAPFLNDDMYSFFSQGLDQYPTTAEANRLTTLDVTFEPGAAPPPGEGQGDPVLTGDLQSWLSAMSTVNTHKTDGLPWLSKEVIDGIRTIVENIPQRTDSLWDIVSKTWQIAGVLTDAEIALWNLFARRAPSQLTGSSGGGGSAFFSGDGRQVANSAAEAVDWGARQWHRTETSNWLTPVPGTDWVLENTLNWAAPFTWQQPADAYVMNITDYPLTADQQDVDGHLWLPRAAWWAPITGDLVHERHFADQQLQVLHALPMRCSGLLFCPRPNYAGTMQAWRRPDP